MARRGHPLLRIATGAAVSAALATAALDLAMGGLSFGVGDDALTTGLEIVAVAAAASGLALVFARRWVLAVLILVLAGACAFEVYRLIIARQTAPRQAARSALLMPGVRPWPSGIVPLCWLNRPAPGTESASDLQSLAAVSAAEAAWSGAGGVQFHDTGECPAEFNGVQLLILRSPADADAPALGAAIADQAEPVALPFAFASRSGCDSGGRFGSLAACVQGEATHEFGHVLGLPDEHYSRAAPEACKATLRQDHPWLVIPYDPASVMNACNSQLLTGRLSASDAAAIRAIYGLPA